LRALRDLDLELVREDRVLGSDTEPAGGDLLDPAVALVTEAGRILAALARVRARAEAVERDRNRLVRLRRQRPLGHGPARDTAHDRPGRLDLVERHRGARGQELEQVAELDRLAAVDEIREAVI